MVNTRSQQSGPHSRGRACHLLCWCYGAACGSSGDCRSCSLIAAQCDIIYFSARKLGCARGGGICIRSEALYNKMRPLVPLYEGFLT